MERETKISASTTNSEKTTIEVGLHILENHLQFRLFYYSSFKTNSTRKPNSSSSVLGNKTFLFFLHSSNTRKANSSSSVLGLMENEDEIRGVNIGDDEYTEYVYEDGQYTNGEEQGFSADEDNHLQEDEDNHIEEDESADDSDKHSESESDSDPNAEQTGTEQNKTRPKRKRGPTRLAKLKKKFNEEGASRKRLKFDRYGRIKTRDAADFSSYLGDLVRERIGLTVTGWKEVKPEERQMLWDTIVIHYKILDSKRKYVMSRLAAALRSFRKRVYHDYIWPTVKEAAKTDRQVLASEFPTTPVLIEPSCQLNTNWVKFVEHVLSPKFQKASKTNREAREKVVLHHTTGRGGYRLAYRRADEDESIDKANSAHNRVLVWAKAFENKKGEITNEKAKEKVQQVLEFDELIRTKDVEVENGQDALTLVFGDDKPKTYFKGGMRRRKYFNLPRKRRTGPSSTKRIMCAPEDVQQRDEIILQQQQQLAAAYKFMQETGQTIPGFSLDKMPVLPSTVVKIAEVPSTNVVNRADPRVFHALVQAIEVNEIEDQTTQSMVQPTQLMESPKSGIMTQAIESQMSPKTVDSQSKKSPSGRSTTFKMKRPSPNSQSDSQPKITTKKPSTKTSPSDIRKDNSGSQNSHGHPVMVSCNLYLDKRDHVARGKALLSKEKQMLHGDPMPGNSLKVTITEALKENAALPYPLKGGGITTVGEAVGTFIGWPTQYISITEKLPEDFVRITSQKQSNGKKQKEQKSNEEKSIGQKRKAIAPGDLQKKIRSIITVKK
ncbi:hypothetical protein OROMI_017306 [Orobanche minor]